MSILAGKNIALSTKPTIRLIYVIPVASLIENQDVSLRVNENGLVTIILYSRQQIILLCQQMIDRYPHSRYNPQQTITRFKR